MNNVKKCTIVCKFLLLHLIALIIQIENFNLYAQDRPIKFDHLGLEQGLSQSSVYCILQDHQGLMWFGTQAGINKFDGYKFTAYQQDVLDSTSLSGNVIQTIYEDHTGAIWAGDLNSACVNRFERDTERFTRFKHDPKNPHSLSRGRVFVIYEDHAGTLWIGTSNGLNKFDREKEQFTRFVYDPKEPKSLHGYVVSSIYEDLNGTLWVGTERWLNKLDRVKEEFTYYKYDPKPSANPDFLAITAILEDRTGTLWVGSEGRGLKKFDRKTEQFTYYFHNPQEPYSLSSDSVRAICEDRSGTLWIGTWSGLDRFEPGSEKFSHFKYDPKNLSSLSDNIIWSIYEDRSGILWVGTLAGGVNKFDRRKEQFTTIAHEADNPHSLSHNTVLSFYKDHTGMLWVGTMDGLDRFDRNTNQFIHFFHDPKDSNSLCNNRVYAICEDRFGMLWIGTSSGLDKFDPITKRFTHFVHDPKNSHSLSNDVVPVIHEDRDGGLWVGTVGGGLSRFDREKEQFTRFVSNPKNPHSIRGSSVWMICDDPFPFKSFWIGPTLNRFDRDTERFIHFLADPKNPNSLNHGYVGALCVDRNGTLWVGTMGGGLNRFDRDTEQFSHFTTKDGLPDNQIRGILEDDHGRLWLGTAKGLSRFDPQTKTFKNYDVADGLASNELWIGGHYKSPDGEMYLSSVMSGFTVFHPDSVKDNSYIPPVVITAFQRYNTEDAEGVAILEKGISAKQEIQISYKDNVLSFEFAALNYRNTSKNQYAYKLEGFTDNWVQLGTKHDITFTNLDPGEYTLYVKGSNNDGIWNEKGTSLKIIITPPWWRTRWAYAFYVLLFMASLYSWRRFDLNRIKLRNELQMKSFQAQKLQEIDSMKSRFFANISHEFRTPLTLILGPVEQIRAGKFKDNLNEACDMILRNGQRLLRLINQLLDLAKLEAGSMSLYARPENIVGFLKGLVLSFASAAERKRIALSIAAEEENLIVYFDRDKLEKIVSNLLSNALKFTPEDGIISVAVSRGEKPFAPTNEYVEISVADTGPGIPANRLDKIFDRFYQIDASHTREHEGTGIGLALTKELVELHHGEIFVKVKSNVARRSLYDSRSEKSI